MICARRTVAGRLSGPAIGEILVPRLLFFPHAAGSVPVPQAGGS